VSDVLLTVAEVAARLKCHPHTVRRWIWSNKLKAVKVGDLVRVPEEEVARFVTPARSDASPHKSTAKALLSTMKRLSKVVNPADVAQIEKFIGEAEQPADWSNPLV